MNNAAVTTLHQCGKEGASPTAFFLYCSSTHHLLFCATPFPTDLHMPVHTPPLFLAMLRCAPCCGIHYLNHCLRIHGSMLSKNAEYRDPLIGSEMVRSYLLQNNRVDHQRHGKAFLPFLTISTSSEQMGPRKISYAFRVARNY
jgi:hypothetical protein